MSADLYSAINHLEWAENELERDENRSYAVGDALDRIRSAVSTLKYEYERLSELEEEEE